MKKMQKGRIHPGAAFAAFIIVGVGLPDDPAAGCCEYRYVPAKTQRWRAVGDAGPYGCKCGFLRYVESL